MDLSLPESAQDFQTWSQVEPYFQALLERSLTDDNVPEWLADWSRLADLVTETFNRRHVAVTVDTTDTEAEAAYNAFLDEIFPAAQAADQQLKQKLMKSGLQPEAFAEPLRKMAAEADLFRESNLPLLSRERKLASQYNRIIGAQTVEWEGQEVTLTGLRPVYEREDRSVRERAWRLASGRQLADRTAINELWSHLLGLRRELARNAGMPDYRAYRWQQMLRLDYSPQDSFHLVDAIEQVAVPAATRIYEKHRRWLGVETLRPWDLDLDLYPIHRPPLPTYGGVDDLERTAERIFHQVDPQLGSYFHILRTERLLDLANRKGKAPGGYCTSFPVTERPFIFMNAAGLSGDIRTILHESGHAFHNFERYRLLYAQQRAVGMEFAEVASMAMELLASPYIGADQGGFYAAADAARFRIALLEHILIFWPYMAVVDRFQHWVYEHPDLAADPENCDAHWLKLWNRFIPGVDWSGLEAEAMTGWHRKQHIFRYPFYYIEYGIAQLGAVQVWNKALEDQAGAVGNYRQALALGGTANLPELFAAAGARFAFDRSTLSAAVKLVEREIDRLEGEAWA